MSQVVTMMKLKTDIVNLKRVKREQYRSLQAKQMKPWPREMG